MDAILALLIVGQASLGSLPAPSECAALKALQLPDITITEATAVAAATTGTVRAPHCKVSGTIGREIRFILPTIGRCC